MKILSRRSLLFIAIISIPLITLMVGWTAFKPGDSNMSGYLFVYFTGNGPGQEAIRFAVSQDGFSYRTLNNNEPVIDSKKISTSGGVRDPHILRSRDGRSFRMVATDLYVPKQGWNNFAMVLMKSSNLVDWESHTVNIPETFPEKFGNVSRVWAPQTIYDEKSGKYMIYFSMKQGSDPDKIYYAYANPEFTALEAAPAQLFFSPTNNACIDGDIIFKDGKYHLFFKSEDGKPGIKLAVSDQLTEGYVMAGPGRIDQSKDPVEGSGIFKLNHTNEWILMYDLYTKGGYQFTRSSDLHNFSVIDHQVTMNFHPRHGTIMPITQKELQTLVSKWGTFDDLLVEPGSDFIKKQNVNFNYRDRKISLPVRRGTDISRFDPEFKKLPGITINRSGTQDFSHGPVKYTFGIRTKGKAEWEVDVAEDHNPVLEGFYADPEILYSEKTGKYYIYPTSDGFKNWSGDFFKVFSSDNLIDWEDCGVILDLKKDVSWADRNAWAPCIVEKKINGRYKYFYYFTAAQKIGVAVSDDPTGPFVDSGQPLIDKKPEGIKGGQEIDPDVFTDPKTGISYLYWGNGYLAGAALNEDMVSVNESTLQIMTPDNTFREGTYVFYRNNTYYFMWSEDDTRSPNYKVRYATSTSPLGKLTIPAGNVVIKQDAEKEIFATGHNSVLQIPGKDQWILVYHRFTYPKGMSMGREAGFHREVCIDKLEFNPDGSIKPVMPTHRGLEAINGSGLQKN